MCWTFNIELIAVFQYAPKNDYMIFDSGNYAFGRNFTLPIFMKNTKISVCVKSPHSFSFF